MVYLCRGVDIPRNCLDNEDFFKRLLLRPLKDGDPVGAELLRVSDIIGHMHTVADTILRL